MIDKIQQRFESSEDGLTLVNMMVGIVLLSFSIVIVTNLLSTSTTTMQSVMRRGELDDIRTHVRLTLDCQQTFRSVPANKAACSTGGSILARNKNGVPFPSSNNNVFNLGKYDVRLDCQDFSTHYGVSTKVRATGSNDAFVETSKIPLACKKGCEPDYQMTAADFSEILSYPGSIPSNADPLDMPDIWSTAQVPYYPLLIAIKCSGGVVPLKDALYYHTATADRVCRCIGYSKSNMSSLHEDGRNGFSSPSDNVMHYWNGTSWTYRAAATDNRWIARLTCSQPICR